MSAIRVNSSLDSTYYKMEYVLYEIRNSKGIPSNYVYESWKADVLQELESAGFITKKDLLYVLTEEGSEVLNYDSFHCYQNKIRPLKLKASDHLFTEKGPKSSKFGIFALCTGLILLVLILAAMKLQLISNI